MQIKERLTEAGIAFKCDEAMSLHTTFKVGGSADIFVLPASTDQLMAAVNICKECNEKYIVVGKGSNLLVSDAGIRGTVICTEKICELIVDGDTIHASAGVMLSALSLKACELGIAGFDFAYGIPGTVGGALVMNAGAYGGEIKDVLVKAEVLDQNGNAITLNAAELELSYRHSCIENKGYTVLGAVFTGKKGDREVIRQAMDEHMIARKEKQPLEFPSAGSTFKRPEGNFAGKLIQDAGLRGFSIGGACVSEKHCGFVVNKGNATAKDVLDVIAYVKNKVYEDSGVSLECEVKLL